MIGYIAFTVDVIPNGQRILYVAEGGYTPNIKQAKVFKELPVHLKDVYVLITLVDEESNNMPFANPVGSP